MDTPLALDLATPEDLEAIEKAGYTVGTDVALALDVASSEFFENGTYSFEGKQLSAAEMTAYYEELVRDYPIVSIEDGCSEEDWDGWSELTTALGDRVPWLLPTGRSPERAWDTGDRSGSRCVNRRPGLPSRWSRPRRCPGRSAT